MGCGWEVLCGTWLVACYGVFFLVRWVSHIRSRTLQIQSDFGKKSMLSGVYAGIAFKVMGGSDGGSECSPRLKLPEVRRVAVRKLLDLHILANILYWSASTAFPSTTNQDPPHIPEFQLQQSTNTSTAAAADDLWEPGPLASRVVAPFECSKVGFAPSYLFSRGCRQNMFSSLPWPRWSARWWSW